MPALLLLWEEYRAGQPEGYGYSRFGDLYRDWRASISPTMRQIQSRPDQKIDAEVALMMAIGRAMVKDEQAKRLKRFLL